MNKLPALSSKPFVSLLILLSLLLSACSETPAHFFDITILNTNMINDFASADLARHINDETKEYSDIPSNKKKGNEAATNLNNKILYLEQSLEKVKKLSTSGDEEKEIKALSQQLYELVIPVYKNEYLAYAKLCDSKGSQSAKDEIINSIDQKYGARFEQNFNALMEKGKAYAQKNNIQVNWGQ
ncbi:MULTISPECIES: hypothetical protein [unclassified Pedobacter]|uniref:hypothetical protein n=1 Tax=unclassified Pedobacter TaxID=2628915 RepID=UPI001E135AA4|nr:MULTISPECIES: hypothetical protein [unclassified Pedobacter]CAH0246507.1 hypothetical protein SRABI126_02838 [Pedobacter sp. Bi126]